MKCSNLLENKWLGETDKNMSAQSSLKTQLKYGAWEESSFASWSRLRSMLTPE